MRATCRPDSRPAGRGAASRAHAHREVLPLGTARGDVSLFGAPDNAMLLRADAVRGVIALLALVIFLVQLERSEPWGISYSVPPRPFFRRANRKSL